MKKQTAKSGGLFYILFISLHRGHHSIDAIIRVWVIRGFRESVEEIVEIVKRAQDRQIPFQKK